MSDPATVIPPGETGDDANQWITARIGNAGFLTTVTSGAHRVITDEPASLGGTDGGPTPYDYLLVALGGCMVMTLRMYADRKGWPLAGAEVRLRTARSHERDCESCEAAPVGVTRIERRVVLAGPLSDEQRARLLSVADRCPVKQTLERGLQVVPAPEA